MSDQSLGLVDEEYWTNPERAKEAAKTFADEGFGGVKLGAPGTVPIDVHDTFPVVALRAGSIADHWAVSFNEHALWASMDLGANRLTVRPAGDPEVETPPANPEDAPSGYMVEPFVVDLRDALSLKWQPGRHLVTVVMRERVSNRADVTLKYSTRKFEDPEVAKFLEAKKATPAPPVVTPPPGDPLPSYEKRDDSPPIPEKPGIALAAERVLVFTPDAQVILRGSFRLPVLPKEVVVPAEPKPGEAPAADVGPPPTAVVGIALLVTGSDLPAPGLAQLTVPSYDPIPDGEKNPVVTGHFALDLLQLGVVPDQPQTLFVYAFSGEVMEGPFPIALISEKMLPK
jgi:hypothetical protein